MASNFIARIFDVASLATCVTLPRGQAAAPPRSLIRARLPMADVSISALSRIEVRAWRSLETFSPSTRNNA